MAAVLHYVALACLCRVQPPEVLPEQLLPRCEASDVASRHREAQGQAVA